MDEVKEAALKYVGSAWDVVYSQYGTPDLCVPGEWYYQGHDGNPGVTFKFEEGFVIDAAALDRSWRPPSHK